MRWRERLAATPITIGVSLWVLVGVWFWASARSSTRLGPDIPFNWELAGKILLVGGIFAAVGVATTLIVYITRAWGVQRSYAGAEILARFCTNRAGEVILYPMGTHPNELRCYVRVRLPDGTSDEYECSFAIYQRVREGMCGRAVCKGNFLLAFYPYAPDTRTATPQS